MLLWFLFVFLSYKTLSKQKFNKTKVCVSQETHLVTISIEVLYFVFNIFEVKDYV